MLAAASLALALGGLVYLADRKACVAVPICSALGGVQPLFGAVGGSLPSFVHVFAFSLLTAAALPNRRRPWYSACAAWAVVNALFELGQHESLRGPLVSALHSLWGPSSIVKPVADYFTLGTFDPMDLLAVGLGAVAAAAVLRRASGSEGLPDAG